MNEETQKNFEALMTAQRFQPSQEAILKFFVEQVIIKAKEEGKREEREEKVEILESLADMYGQYCGENGHDFMSAGEHAVLILERYNLINPNKAGGGLILWDNLQSLNK